MPDLPPNPHPGLPDADWAAIRALAAEAADSAPPFDDDQIAALRVLLNTPAPATPSRAA